LQPIQPFAAFPINQKLSKTGAKSGAFPKRLSNPLNINPHPTGSTPLASTFINA
jgi:hypothetical protein